MGIDIEVGEVLLCEKLRERGLKIDLLLSHHPGGRAYANLYDVMRIQSDILHRFGVPISVAEDLMDGRIREVERKLMPVNHTRAVDAAKLLGMPFICLHTPSDNMVATYLQETFDKKGPYTVADVMNILRSIPGIQGSLPYRHRTEGPSRFRYKDGGQDIRGYDGRYGGFERDIFRAWRPAG